MKVVKAGYKEIMEKDVSKKIEQIARVCYKSEDKIGPGTDMAMIKKLVARKHYAMLEHASLVYRVSKDIYNFIKDVISERMHDITWFTTSEVPNTSRIKFTKFCHREPRNNSYVISGNIRAWIEFLEFIHKNKNSGDLYDGSLCHVIMQLYVDSKHIVDFMNDLIPGQKPTGKMQLVTDFTELYPAERMVHETFSVLFTCDRGVTHEFVRMRDDCSFAQESTRYCNYSNGKFGNEIAVIDPVFWSPANENRENFSEEAYEKWEEICGDIEIAYNKLTGIGAPAQQARSVLPTSTKADIVITTTLMEWRHIFALRACDMTGPAHPQMKEIMVPLFLKKKEDYPFAFGDLEAVV